MQVEQLSVWATDGLREALRLAAVRFVIAPECSCTCHPTDISGLVRALESCHSGGRWLGWLATSALVTVFVTGFLLGALLAGCAGLCCRREAARPLASGTFGDPAPGRLNLRDLALDAGSRRPVTG